MFKRNFFKILAIIFFLLSGATFYNSNKTKPVVVKKILIPTKVPAVILSPIISKAVTPTTEPTQAIVNPTNTPVPQPTNTPSPAEASAKEGQGLKVSLSIGGSSVGTIDLSNGVNQCDVLSQALSQGKIQSLNMRYNNDLGTNAVYQINSVGKENSVWWTFKVNGQSPSQGCSYIKVNNADNVEWDYLGN
ncbi:MAG: hypothetical protein UR42_C0018G0001 [Candidatus Roizmanbacteria bacterium GW2011_GWA2_33_33]|uniref:Transcobalamin-like C-terminal domain-containing protein n=2 Tax=Candidatus Roizmaniibacteriota TaxID=1752723 RepID=A0A0G0E779_9BACT|nr:MAG: hypothetical protein UR42_C0018G0001 [Candidatus Roizmanbacteria bacterium GW2011_GWA2_33_33]KKP63222.1 MAG: hypothetical protein UR56_C0001G0029 [Candidatus Roizmanbacteria bacterium GW2011_GWC2_34_23]